MPLLGALLYKFFEYVAAFLVKNVTQKMAVGLALFGVLSAITAAVFVALRVAMNLALTGVGSVHPMFATGIGVVISPTTQGFITAYFVLYGVCELYKWKFNIFQLWSRTI